MKCNELKAYVAGIDGILHENKRHGDVYLKDDVNEAIAELKAENERLTIDKRNAELRADVADATVEKQKAENAELKQKLEVVQATAYEESMDAGVENWKLRKALWLITAEWAEAMGLASCNIANKFMIRENFEVSDDYRNKTIKRYMHRQVVFYKYADYCRKKVEAYK